MKNLALAIICVCFASCSQDFDYKVADSQTSGGHIDGFIENSEKNSLEIQKDSINLQKTVLLTVCLEEFQTKYPKEYGTIAVMSDGWQIAQALKSNGHFRSIAKKNGFDLSQVPFIGKEKN